MKKGLKLLPIALGLGACVAFGACAKNNMAVVHAEEEVIEPTVTEVTLVDEEPSEDDNWLKKTYDTYIVPLLGGVSITSIVSALVCIATTIFKNKALNKKIIDITKKSDEQYNASAQKLVEVTEILNVIHEVIKIVDDSKQISEEIKAEVDKNLKEISKVVEDNSNEVMKIEKLSQLTKLLIQLEGKVVSQTKNAVQSGIVGDVNNIVNLAKDI